MIQIHCLSWSCGRMRIHFTFPFLSILHLFLSPPLTLAHSFLIQSYRPQRKNLSLFIKWQLSHARTSAAGSRTHRQRRGADPRTSINLSFVLAPIIIAPAGVTQSIESVEDWKGAPLHGCFCVPFRVCRW